MTPDRINYLQLAATCVAVAKIFDEIDSAPEDQNWAYQKLDKLKNLKLTNTLNECVAAAQVIEDISSPRIEYLKAKKVIEGTERFIINSLSGKRYDYNKTASN